MRQIAYSKQSRQALRRMDRKQATLIRQKIEAYAKDPASMAANVKKLQGSEHYRLRVGNWRVIFDDDGVILQIIKVASRGSVY